MQARTARLALALTAGLLALAGCEKPAPPPAARPVPEVTVVTVQPRDLPVAASFVATTESSREVQIVARVSGFLDRVAYTEGKPIKEGALMFELDRKPLQAQVEAARGALQANQARLATAEASLRRVKPLVEQNALSQSDLDRAQGEHDSAKAAVFSAQANLTQAELNLGYATIRAPASGLAGRALQQQGAYVSATASSAHLSSITAIDPIWVNFSVSQNQLASWREEQRKGRLVVPRNEEFDVELVMPDGTVHPHRGRVNFSAPSFSLDTGSFAVRASLPNPKGVMRPGMAVTAVLKGAVRSKVMVVPQLAVQLGPNGHLVYVVNAEGNAELRPVTVGDYVGEKDIIVASGLHPGDRVVATGTLRVAPGRPVKVVEAAAAAAGAAAAASAPPAPPSGAASAAKK